VVVGSRGCLAGEREVHDEVSVVPDVALDVDVRHVVDDESPADDAQRVALVLKPGEVVATTYRSA
jgi:hypothetical protein